MPEDRKLAFFASEAEKVKHHSVNHSIRQGVLLVQQHPHEDAVGAVVVHLSDLEQRGTGVKDWNGGLGQDTAQDYGFPQRTRPTLNKSHNWGIISKYVIGEEGG